MILREATIKYAGYDPDDLKPKSNKRVCCSCDECGRVRWMSKANYSNLCKICAHKFEKNSVIVICDNCKKEVEIHFCELNHNLHFCNLKCKNEYYLKDLIINKWIIDNQNKHLCQCGCGEFIEIKRNYYFRGIPKFIQYHYCKTDSAKNLVRKIHTGKTNSQETREKISSNHSHLSIRRGMRNSKEHNKHISAGHQNISYEEWEGYVQLKEYCSAFNEECRESNREKYDRRCFLCNKTEEENGRKNSVHHYDMDKKQGYDGKRWKLVSVCNQCHGRCHTEDWEARIVWLLENVWNNEDYGW